MIGWWVREARMPRRLSLPLAALVLVACTSMEGMPAAPSRTPVKRTPPPPTSALTTAGFRESPGVAASGGQPAPYNYGPTVMRDGDRYRLWWCSQLPGIGPAGDDILYAESAGLDGGFAASGGPAVPVFAGQPGAFDGMHTCDPSVLKVADRYFLYYTGAAGDHAHGNAIGVASSTDGRAWRREGAGRPIVTASGEVRGSNVYGAGQPSVVHLDGWFYMMFTDTTASGAGWNGAGQFVLRARDPEFSDRVQALTDNGFQPTGSTEVARKRSIVDAFSADWMWVDALDAFAVAHQTDEGTSITFWDRNFGRQPYWPVVIPGPWREGPGLVRQSDGHAPVSASDPCGTLQVDVLRATHTNPAPTNLRRYGVDITGLDACETARQAKSILDGFAMPSPERTVDVVHNGAKVRIERRSVAELMAIAVLDEPIRALDDLPVSGRIPARRTAWRSPDGRVALIDERGRLWTVKEEVAVANDSEVTGVSQQRWETRSHAGDLR